MSATLRDVANLAGVSVKTVSNVVNGCAFVRADNRRRVEQALAATGYRPNLGARNLRKGRTGFVALIVPELGIPYFGELAGLVIAAAQRRDWSVLIEETRGVRDREQAALAGLGPHLVDGAIVSPEALNAADLRAFDPGVPLVLLGEHTVRAPLDRVAIDNVLAARTAVAHLVAIGRRRIALIGKHAHRGTAAQRLAGYRQALAEAGLSRPGGLVAAVARYHRADGARAMAGLLAARRPPDAVFCCNDLLAAGAVRAAADRGVRIPDDVAVVGFDDNEESAYSVPSLTTVAPDKAAIAGQALDLLHGRATGTDGGPPRQVVTPFSLVIRESTRIGAPQVSQM